MSWAVRMLVKVTPSRAGTAARLHDPNPDLLDVLAGLPLGTDAP